MLAVSDHAGSIADEDGIDAFDLTDWVQEHGSVKGYPNADEIEPSDLWSMDVDILIPAALENQINVDNANDIRAKVVVEAANGPTTLEAEEILSKKNVDILPDILVNAGGVIVSYFEWLQNRSAQRWDLDDVDYRLREILWSAADSVVALREDLGASSRRDAAYAVALQRLKTVYNQRGIFP